MARRGDGLYLRGRTWWLDFTHHGKRHIVGLGRIITWTARPGALPSERDSVGAAPWAGRVKG